ncbi:succinylglutamate desuccinylase/aspartoacylase family protein [Seongchinamella unica]|uniref:Succinylglutamate desuccinylase/aspartoacylase family protein n=2 Tax=Seongchinamella unica TaxID=2547392 RepID=A0A4R5LVD2_9GAMM|nr:succinylglutamate desuccinylase/aspartoacylase family protein [Seongchinamella unica]
MDVMQTNATTGTRGGLIISLALSIALGTATAAATETSAVETVSEVTAPAGEEPASPLPDQPDHLPQAESVDLGDPVSPEEPEPPRPAVAQPEPPREVIPAEAEVAETPPLILLGKEVRPSTATRLSWSPAQSFEGLASPTSVLVVHGAKPGPALCLTAALHGDEINGVEIVRRVLYAIAPEELSGSVIGVPIVNMQGFQRGSRYLPDRRDLNRYFPGYENGSAAARIAFSFFNEVIQHCSALIDLHTGSFDRTNLPQLRADLSNQAVLDLTQGFGATTILHSAGAVGTLRRSATEHGIPAVTIEAGGPIRLQEEAISHSVKSIKTLMNHLGMVDRRRTWGAREPVYYESRWVRADSGGILQSVVKLGERVDQDELLGTVINPITNVSTSILSPFPGRVLGMAYDQVVMPGYAAYHIGINAPIEELPIHDSDQPTSTPPEHTGEETSLDSPVADDTDAEQQPVLESPVDEPEYDE